MKEPVDEGEREEWKKKKRKKESEVIQSCPTLCDPMDCSLPGFSVHGIFQARVPKWVAISLSGGSSQPRDQTRVSQMQAAAWPSESPGKPKNEKAGLKLNLQKTKLMSSGPITSWQIDGERLEIVTDFVFLGYKIIADNDCSHEIQRCLLHGRKAVTNLERILKAQMLLYLQRSCSQSYVFFQ